jgi:predicted RNA binding protein YcfA (HicA-like mRNA interferase family)
MSTRLKRLSGRDVAALLVKLGFDVVNTRGSHAKLRRTLPTGTTQILTIPLHRTLAPGTLHAIYRQASRFVPESDLRPHFFTGRTPPSKDED